MRSFVPVIAVLLVACGARGGPTTDARERDTATSNEWTGQTVARAEELMTGRFPGVDVTPLAGGGVSVRIRGASSILGSAEPLFVVDGTPIEAGPGGALTGISPSDIAKIQVLKDIGSTSLYGARGANGVIVITTKQAAATAVSRQPYHAIVDGRYNGKDGGVVRGMKMYRTLAAAVAEVPADNIEPFVISLRNGRYHEKLTIDKPFVQLIGESRDGTILTYDAAAGHSSPAGTPWTTHGSYTLRITAPGFRLENMTVENAFDYMTNYRKASDDPTKLVGSQGVAVMLDAGSDRAVFRNCTIRGHQDTLFPDAGRSYFTRCTISGSVDFIFGAGRAVFDDVDVISRDRGSQSNNGYITAPSTNINQPYGLVFINSRLKKEPGMAANTVVLGRPWHPQGDPNAIGSAVFINTWMDDHIGAKGWDNMFSTDPTGKRTEHLAAETRFLEFGSTGPGAVSSPTRRSLSVNDLDKYTIIRVLDGWDPTKR